MLVGLDAGVRPLVVRHTSLSPLCPIGNNENGQLGVGASTAPLTAPTSVSGSVTSWAAIAAGGIHTCGLAAANGNAYCWGEALCQCGYHTCGLAAADGAAYCWGEAL
jgi:hypothetical protein